MQVRPYIIFSSGGLTRKRDLKRFKKLTRMLTGFAESEGLHITTQSVPGWPTLNWLPTHASFSVALFEDSGADEELSIVTLDKFQRCLVEDAILSSQKTPTFLSNIMALIREKISQCLHLIPPPFRPRRALITRLGLIGPVRLKNRLSTSDWVADSLRVSLIRGSEAILAQYLEELQSISEEDAVAVTGVVYQMARGIPAQQSPPRLTGSGAEIDCDLPALASTGPTGTEAPPQDRGFDPRCSIWIHSNRDGQCEWIVSQNQEVGEYVNAVLKGLL